MDILGLKYLKHDNAFSSESPYFVPISGMNYEKNEIQEIGRYEFAGEEDRGVEPKFKAKKRWIQKDTHRMLHDNTHKYFQQAMRFIDSQALPPNQEEYYATIINNLKTFDENRGKFEKIHYIKLDYSNDDNILSYFSKNIQKVQAPYRRTKNPLHWLGTIQAKDKANRNAVKECLANDLMRLLVGRDYTQKLKIVPACYEDGKPKLLLDATHMQGSKGETFHTFSQTFKNVSIDSSPRSLGEAKLVDGYLICDQDMCKAEVPKNYKFTTEDTIKDLGKFKIMMLLLGDRDAVGSEGGNKGYLWDPQKSDQKFFAAIDPGHSLETGKYYFKTDLMKFLNINNDFSLKPLPGWTLDQIMGGYKNFTIFDDTPFLEKMEGVVHIASLNEEDKNVFEQYRTFFNGKKLHKELNFDGKIKEIEEAYDKRKNYILNEVFKERLLFMGSKEGELALNILDCFEKQTSLCNNISNNGKVRLTYPKVIKRVEWHIAKEQTADGKTFYFFETEDQKKVKQLLRNLEIHFSDSEFPGKIHVKCESLSLEELNQKIDLNINQYKHWKERKAKYGILAKPSPDENLNIDRSSIDLNINTTTTHISTPLDGAQDRNELRNNSPIHSSLSGRSVFNDIQNLLACRGAFDSGTLNMHLDHLRDIKNNCKLISDDEKKKKLVISLLALLVAFSPEKFNSLLNNNNVMQTIEVFSKTVNTTLQVENPNILDHLYQNAVETFEQFDLENVELQSISNHFYGWFLSNLTTPNVVEYVVGLLLEELNKISPFYIPNNPS